MALIAHHPGATAQFIHFQDKGQSLALLKTSQSPKDLGPGHTLTAQRLHLKDHQHRLLQGPLTDQDQGQ